MQAFFARVDLAAYRQQQQATAKYLTEHPPPRAVTPPPPRAVGRPKKKRLAAEALAAAAEAADLAATQVNKRVRGHVRWFSSPYITDILHAHRLQGGSARRTVDYLRAHAPDDRYAKLSHVTVHGWFEHGKLKTQHQQELDDGFAHPNNAAGASSPLDAAAGASDAISDHLLQLRMAGMPLNSHIVRWVMQAVLQSHPEVQQQLSLSQQFISKWVRNNPRLQFRWRARTTAASKLPDDWAEQGIRMAQRMGATMQLHKIHPSLVINMDQTGVHFVSASSWTYEMVGSSDVAIVGAEDKRQITACVAASLRGDLLPLQLIFQGKTTRSLPPATPASTAARVDITHSANHWSTQETMQRWITNVLHPHSERMISMHNLNANAHILLLLDCWAVHKSDEFRTWLQREHPRIHLVFVPPNCTSKLQLADVALQRPFKSCITQSFNHWAAGVVAEQIQLGEVTGIAGLLGMAAIKPLVLQWCVDSWNGLRERKQLILDGWERSCLSMFDITSEHRRNDAVEMIALKQLELDVLPDGAEPDGYPDADEDNEDDELDISKPRTFGKQSTRIRTQAKTFGFQIDPTRIEIDQEPAAAAASR